MAVNHDQIKYSRMPRGRNQMPYYGQCPDNEMMHMQRDPCFSDVYGNKMDGPCGMGVSEFKSPMMTPDPPPPPAKKKRRASNAMGSVNQPIQPTPMPDLLPPPLTGYGDTIVASNPFDDTPPAPSMSHMNSMNHVDKHIGVGTCMSPASNPAMGSMSPCHQIVGSPMQCGSPLNCGPPICSPMNNSGSSSGCGPIGSPLTGCNSRQISRSPLVCPPNSAAVMANNGMNPMNRSPSSIGSPLGSVMASNVRGNSPLDCGGPLGVSPVGSQKGSPMMMMSSHSMSNMNCRSLMGSPSNVPISNCSSGSMTGSPIASPLSVPCSIGGGPDMNVISMANVLNRSPMNAGPNSVMCNQSMQGPPSMSGNTMMNCNPMNMGPKPDMGCSEMAMRESHMPLKPPNGPGGCGLPPNMSGPRPPDMRVGPMGGMHCNTMMSNQCPSGMNNIPCMGGNINRVQCGPSMSHGGNMGPGPNPMGMNNIYERSHFPRGMPGVGYGCGPMNLPGGPGLGVCGPGPQGIPMGCNPNSGPNAGGMTCPDGMMNHGQCMGPGPNMDNMNHCLGSPMFNSSQFSTFEMNNSRCSPNLNFSTNDINSMNTNNANRMAATGPVLGSNQNNFYSTNMASISCMSNIVNPSPGVDSLHMGHSIMSTGTMKNDCSSVDNDLNTLACSMTSTDPNDDLSLLDEHLLRDVTSASLTITTPSSSSTTASNPKINCGNKSSNDLFVDDPTLVLDSKDCDPLTSKLGSVGIKLEDEKDIKLEANVGQKDVLTLSPTNTSISNMGSPQTTTVTPPATSMVGISSGNSGATSSPSNCDPLKVKSEIEEDSNNGVPSLGDRIEISKETSTQDNKDMEEKLLSSPFCSEEEKKSNRDDKSNLDEAVVKNEDGELQKDSPHNSLKMGNNDFFDQTVKKSDNASSTGLGPSNGNSFSNVNVPMNVSTSGEMIMNNTSPFDSSMCGMSMLPTMNRLNTTNQTMNYSNKPHMNLYRGGRQPNSSGVQKCRQCLEEIKASDDYVLCESGCSLWYHRECIGMSEDAYKFMKVEVCTEWVCDKCMQTGTIPPVKLKS